jgi:hypothetical protein
MLDIDSASQKFYRWGGAEVGGWRGSVWCEVWEECMRNALWGLVKSKIRRAPIWPSSRPQTVPPFVRPIKNPLTEVCDKWGHHLRSVDSGPLGQTQSGCFKNLLRTRSVLIGWTQTRGVLDSTEGDLSHDTVRSMTGRVSRESKSSKRGWFILFILIFVSVGQDLHHSLTPDHCWRVLLRLTCDYLLQVFEASSSDTGPSEFVVGGSKRERQP